MSFIKDAIITDVEKHDGGWWLGNIGRKKKKWSVTRCERDTSVSTHIPPPPPYLPLPPPPPPPPPLPLPPQVSS